MDSPRRSSRLEEIKWTDSSSIEKFKKSVPQFKSLLNENYWTTTVPDEVWPELEGLINRKGTSTDKKIRLINKISTVVPCSSTTNWGESFLNQDVKNLVRKVREKTNNGHFEVFMDCLAYLIEDYDDIEFTNDFLKEHNIGYMLVRIPGFIPNYKWAPLDTDIVKEDLLPVIEKVKPVSKQAREEFDRARKLLQEPTTDRTRKDILSSCLRAMEAVIKEYGRDKNIDNATKKLQETGDYGSPQMVRDGKTIFHELQDICPDIRHGALCERVKEISPEETEYWLRRIVAFTMYLIQRGEKVRKTQK